jgi:hypothetical protein
MLVTLDLSEGTIYSVRYLTVKPSWDRERDGWYNQDWNDMMAWCVATYGPSPDDGVWTPGARWYANNAKFWFLNELDLALFVLKWK